jgi:hypothetical protein
MKSSSYREGPFSSPWLIAEWVPDPLSELARRIPIYVSIAKIKAAESDKPDSVHYVYLANNSEERGRHTVPCRDAKTRPFLHFDAPAATEWGKIKGIAFWKSARTIS